MAKEKKDENPEEKTTSENAERANEIFEAYPEADKIHFTSDGLAFFEESDAKNHALSLEEKEIETIKKV